MKNKTDFEIFEEARDSITNSIYNLSYNKIEELEREITKEVFFKAGYKKAQEDFKKVIDKKLNNWKRNANDETNSIKNQRVAYFIFKEFEELKKEIGKDA